MPRYFIDSDDGDLLVLDEEGLDYINVQAARDMILATLPDMARHGLKASNRRTFSARIRDESGAIVYCASLRLDEEWPINPSVP